MDVLYPRCELMMTAMQDQIRIGYLSTVYHTSYLLMGTAILREMGIAAEWNLFPSGPDIIAAMREGKLDLGYIGLPPTMIAIDQGMDIRCIAGGHIEGTVIVGRNDLIPLEGCRDLIEFLSQLTAVGCPPRGSIHDVIITDLLKRSGMEDCIRVVNYPWADFLPDALQKGEIQAAAGTPALAVAARRYADMKTLVPPDRIWPYNPSYGIVVTGKIRENDNLLSRFLIAHERASEEIRHDPVGSAGIASSVTGFFDPAFILETYLISPKYCASLPKEYISSTMAFADALVGSGYISGLLSAEEIFDTSLIKEVHRSPPHYDLGIEKKC